MIVGRNIKQSFQDWGRGLKKFRTGGGSSFRAYFSSGSQYPIACHDLAKSMLLLEKDRMQIKISIFLLIVSN